MLSDNNKEDKFSVEYPFIKKNIFLRAKINSEGKQELVIYQKDLNTGEILKEDHIQCIHTAVMKIPVEDFVEKVKDEDFSKEVLNIRSSEGLIEINLQLKRNLRHLRVG